MAADLTAGTAPARGTARARFVSDFTALTKQVQEAGLLRRAYGYYWTKMIALTLLGLGLAAAFVLIGDTWWQLVTAAVLAALMAQSAFLGHDAAHRQLFVSGRWKEGGALVVTKLVVGRGPGWGRLLRT